ncbi:MAG: SHOCT domain-containing protein [Vicinamibacterales bacterium]
MSLVLHGGQGKTLFVSRDSIRIVQEHLDERRDKAILLRHVTAVEVKKPGAFDGFIQFSFAGGTPHDRATSLTGGAFDAARDENSVTFKDMDSYDIALKIKVHVEAWSPAAHGPGEPRLPATDEIRALKALLDEEALAPEEFAARKKLLLGL